MVLLSGRQYVQGFLLLAYICIAVGKIIKCEGWEPINRLNHGTCLSQAVICIKIVIYIGMIMLCSMVLDGCSFCWYLWNC